MDFAQFTITQTELDNLHPQQRLKKRSTFVARDEREILGCIDYYMQRGLAFPPQREDALVLQGSRLDILLEYTLMSSHRVEIPVLPEISFHVNPNAWSTFKHIAQDYETYNRGGLYKWDTGNTVYSQFYFLDREIMKALQSHDLRPYEERMSAWITEDQRVIADAEREGIIGRLPGQLRVYDGEKK